MALNLSTLTSPATSDDVLAEVLTTADFLEPVPVLRNLARGTNAGGDAKQDVALNQPKALPLIDGDGYLYVSGITGNSATVPHESSFNLTNELEIVAHVKYRSYSGADAQNIVAKWASGDFNFRFHTSGYLQIFFKDSANTSRTTFSAHTVYDNEILDGDTIWVKLTIDASSTSTNVDFYTSKDNVRNESDVTWSALGTTRVLMTSGGILSGTNLVSFGAFDNSGGINDDLATGAILKANYKSAIGGSPVLDVDFTSTNVRHGDTKFKCATGQTVTINQSGNDPATIIKKPVLRFDGVNNFMDGVFNQTVTGGYMFAAFSVLGDSGEDSSRIFGINSTGLNDNNTGGAFYGRYSSSDNFNSRYNGSSSYLTHQGLFNSDNADILLEAKFIDGSQTSKINNADEDNGANTTIAGDLSAEEFNIASYTDGNYNPAIDLEYLALFPADSVPDEATASKIRNYINNRNNVFLRHDTDGYYFYNPQDLSSGAVTTWNGRIVGSDNGDADKNATQSTSADQPTSDGYKVTFADNTDHFDIPSTTQAGWQIVGTSLGTFVYKVDSDAVTELNLLGNLGNASYRKAGDLYGIILLPESATGREINEAKKLLTDRGASVSAATSVQNAWRNRSDIVQFNGGDMSDVTDARYAFRSCTSLTSFSSDLPLVTNADYAWYACSSLESFSSQLPSVTNLNQAFHYCYNLESFDLVELPLLVDARYAFRNCTSLTSFDTRLPKVAKFNQTWDRCTSLSDFSADVFSNWNPSSINSGVFNNAWGNCTSLTAQSVENILTSIDASGKYATSTGASGGTALADAGIDIDYNGDPLSAATTAAITSLKAKGWSIFINSVEQ